MNKLMGLNLQDLFVRLARITGLGSNFLFCPISLLSHNENVFKYEIRRKFVNLTNIFGNPIQWF